MAETTKKIAVLGFGSKLGDYVGTALIEDGNFDGVPFPHSYTINGEKKYFSSTILGHYMQHNKIHRKGTDGHLCDADLRLALLSADIFQHEGARDKKGYLTAGARKLRDRDPLEVLFYLEKESVGKRI